MKETLKFILESFLFAMLMYLPMIISVIAFFLGSIGVLAPWVCSLIILISAITVSIGIIKERISDIEDFEDLE